MLRCTFQRAAVGALRSVLKAGMIAMRDYPAVHRPVNLEKVVSLCAMQKDRFMGSRPSDEKQSRPARQSRILLHAQVDILEERPIPELGCLQFVFKLILR